MQQRSFTSSVVRDEASTSRDPRDDDPRVAQPELLRWLRARLRTPHDALRAAVFVLCGVLVLLQLRRAGAGIRILMIFPSLFSQALCSA